MDVPSTGAGVVKSVAVKKGDRVSKGSAIVTLEADSGQRTADSAKPAASAASDPQPSAVSLQPAASAASVPSPSAVRSPLSAHDYEVVVLGAGLGGYTAAFRAADLGM